jgi:hypothetical protein
MDPAIVKFVSDYSLFGIPAVVLVFAIVALAKLLGLPSRWAPVAAVIAGLLVATAIQAIAIRPDLQTWILPLVLGLMLGLVTVGAHAAVKSTLMRFQFVPPGTAIKTATGQVDVTPTDTFTDGKRGPKKKGTV